MTNLLLKDSIVGIVKVDRFVFRGLKMRLFPILFSVFFLTALYAPSAHATTCRYEITFYTYFNQQYRVLQSLFTVQQLDSYSGCDNLMAGVRTHLDSIPRPPDGPSCLRYTYSSGELDPPSPPTIAFTHGSCTAPTRPVKPGLDHTADSVVSSRVDALDSDSKVTPKQSVRE